MDKLIESVKPGIEQSVKKKVKQEHKQIGRVSLKRGMKMFGMGEDLKVYKVDIQENKAVAFETRKRKSHLKTTINPEHLFLQALNMKNAKRKFSKGMNEYTLAVFNKANQ